MYNCKKSFAAMSQTNIITRRKTPTVLVRGLEIGSNHPVRIQSMTDTRTDDIESTVNQIMMLADAGSELVRITVNDAPSAAAVPEIRSRLNDSRYDHLPIVGDFHYNGHKLLREYPECAQSLDKYRINPGNVGFGAKQDAQFQAIIETAIKYNKPVRIGVNWGSLDQEVANTLMDENARSSNPKSSDEIIRDALVISALTNAERAMKLGLDKDKIIISCKVSKVQDVVAVYKDLSAKTDCALHLGLTEAGMGIKGIASSAAAMSLLLQEGIGDTLRVSLTPGVGSKRDEEVKVAQEIVQSLGIRSFAPSVTSCPGCGRTSSTFFRELAAQVQEYIAQELNEWTKLNSDVTKLNIAVMGCIVNGPGESKHADVGISLPGNGENPAAPVFVDGKKVCTLRGDNIAQEFKDILSNYISDRFSA